MKGREYSLLLSSFSLIDFHAAHQRTENPEKASVLTDRIMFC